MPFWFFSHYPVKSKPTNTASEAQQLKESFLYLQIKSKNSDQMGISNCMNHTHYKHGTKSNYSNQICPCDSIFLLLDNIIHINISLKPHKYNNEAQQVKKISSLPANQTHTKARTQIQMGIWNCKNHTTKMESNRICPYDSLSPCRQHYSDKHKHKNRSEAQQPIKIVSLPRFQEPTHK